MASSRLSSRGGRAFYPRRGGDQLKNAQDPDEKKNLRKLVLKLLDKENLLREKKLLLLKSSTPMEDDSPLAAVERSIRDVEEEIKAVKDQLKNAQDPDEKKNLWEDKKHLQKKEEQLWEKKLLLLKSTVPPGVVTGGSGSGPGTIVQTMAFEHPYSDRGNVSTLKRYLEIILEGDGLIKAGGVFQSSGWGKSRSVCELAREGVWVIYLTFGGGSGFPCTPAFATKFLDEAGRRLSDNGTLSCMNYGLAYFVGCYQELTAWRGLQLASSQQELQISFVRMLWTAGEDAAKFWTGVHNRMESLFKEIEERVMHSSTEPEAIAFDIWKDNALLFIFLHVKLEMQQELKYVFVFDGARRMLGKADPWTHVGSETQLKNIFVPIRRAFRSMRSTMGTVGLFLDTASELTKDWLDGSSGMAPGAYFIPSPLWCCFAADAPDIQWKEVVPTKKFSDIVKPYWTARYGRPLWWSRFISLVKHGFGVKGAFGEVEALARDKLLGGRPWAMVFLTKYSLGSETAAAIIGLRAAVDVDPRARMASKLVAGHMLTVVAVGESGELVSTAWSDEPLLTRIAADAMIQLQELGRLKELYDPLIDGLAAGWVDRGYTGEFVGRILLICAMDKARQGREFCTVAEFLEALVGRTDTRTRKKLLVDEFWKTAKLNCLSFRRVYKKVSELTFDDLQNCLERRAGIITVEGEFGEDCIVVAYAGTDEEEVKESNLAVLHFNFKIRNRNRTTIDLAKISPEYAGWTWWSMKPHFSMFINVEQRQTPVVSRIDMAKIEKTVRKSSRKVIVQAVKELELEDQDRVMLEADSERSCDKDEVMLEADSERSCDKDEVKGTSSGVKEVREVGIEDEASSTTTTTKKPSDNWKAWLRADKSTRMFVFVSGLDAFQLHPQMMEQLERVVTLRRGGPFCREPSKKLGSDIFKLQVECLDKLMPGVQIKNFHK